MAATAPLRVALLASAYLGTPVPVQVCRSGGGFYLGYVNEEGPISRESAEYWRTRAEAEAALVSGDWTQRLEP